MCVNVSVFIKQTIRYENTGLHRKVKGLQLKYGPLTLPHPQKDKRVIKCPCPWHCSPLTQYQNVAVFKLRIELVLFYCDFLNCGATK